MNPNIALLKALSPNGIVLEIDEQSLVKTTAIAEKFMPNATARQLYILNSLCCNAVRSWLQDSIAVEDEEITIPDERTLRALWSVVTGIPLTVGSLQIVAIAEEALDTAGLTIPREWIDIPQWQPDYFIAAQVDLDKQFILLWGYASLATVKQNGALGRSHQHYLLTRDELSQDVPLLGTGSTPTRPTTATPSVSQAVVGSETRHRLLDKLSEPSPFSPRLDVPFATWSALVVDGCWLQNLYERRCKNAGNPAGTPVTDLFSWLTSDLTDAFQAGWRDFGELVGPRRSESGRVAFVSRSHNRLRDNGSEGTRIEKAKVIDLKIQLDRSVKVILLVAISENSAGNFGIIAQLHPESSISYLPESIQLKLTSGSSTVEEATARLQDRCLQIPFSCPDGTSFELEVVLDGTSCVEKFVVARSKLY